MRSHKLIFNVKKTKYMVFTPPSMKGIHVPKIYLNDECITLVNKECYLGFTVTNDYQDDEAIGVEVRKLYARGNMIVRKFKNCTDAVKKQLFLSYCCSFYCCSLWSHYKSSTFKRIHIAHNNIFRAIFRPQQRSISQCFVEHNVPNFLVIRRKLIFSLQHRLFSSQNVLVSTVINSMYFNNSDTSQNWKALLY